VNGSEGEEEEAWTGVARSSEAVEALAETLL